MASTGTEPYKSDVGNMAGWYKQRIADIPAEAEASPCSTDHYQLGAYKEVCEGLLRTLNHVYADLDTERERSAR